MTETDSLKQSLPPSFVDLILQHAGRLASIVAVLSISAQVFQTFEDLSTKKYVAFVLVVISLLFLWTEIKTISKRKYLPNGELGLVFLGQVISFISNPVKFATSSLVKYGKQATWNLSELMFTTADPDDIAWLWNAERKSQFKISWVASIERLLGPVTVSTTDGDTQRRLKRMLEPAFAPNAIRDYLQNLDAVTCQHLEKWCSTESYHSSFSFKMFALNLFFVAAFGKADPEVEQKFHDHLTVWLNGFAAILLIEIPGTIFAKAMNARRSLKKLCREMILRFKKEFPPDTEHAKKSLMGRICYATDESGKPLSMEWLEDNIINIVFAGHDTTFMGISTALYYLTRNPELRGAIMEEVDAFGEILDFDDLRNAPILNAFLAESLRMEPPVVGGYRRVTSAKPLKRGPFQLPFGLVYHYNIHAAVANPEAFPKPSKFSISRYLPEGHPLKVEPELHLEGYTPNSLKSNYPIFGGGVHGCLGFHFAKMEMRVVLVRLLQMYTFEIRNPVHVSFPVRGWSYEFKLTRRAPGNRSTTQKS